MSQTPINEMEAVISEGTLKKKLKQTANLGVFSLAKKQ